VVMRDGDILESGPCLALLNEPAHPYTRELVRAVNRS
jgi:ABC-type dipeptide/oligopeptide/nickel transport system ATPase component